MKWLDIAIAFVKGGIAEVSRAKRRPKPTPEDAARDQARVRAELDRIEDANREQFERERVKYQRPQ